MTATPANAWWRNVPWGVVVAGLVLVAGVAWWVQPEPVPVPRPRGHVRISLPDTAYRQITSPCGTALTVPTYAGVVPVQRPTSAAEGCWYDVFFPRLRATVHCTEVPVQGNLDLLLEDAQALVFGHEVAAAGLRRSALSEPDRSGMLYVLEGPVAAPIQFYLTDSTTFLRGSLYFNNRPNPDSTAPVLARMEADLRVLMERTVWP